MPQSLHYMYMHTLINNLDYRNSRLSKHMLVCVHMYIACPRSHSRTYALRFHVCPHPRSRIGLDAVPGVATDQVVARVASVEGLAANRDSGNGDLSIGWIGQIHTSSHCKKSCKKSELVQKLVCTTIRVDPGLT